MATISSSPFLCAEFLLLMQSMTGIAKADLEVRAYTFCVSRFSLSGFPLVSVQSLTSFLLFVPSVSSCPVSGFACMLHAPSADTVFFFADKAFGFNANWDDPSGRQELLKMARDEV